MIYLQVEYICVHVYVCKSKGEMKISDYTLIPLNSILPFQLHLPLFNLIIERHILDISLFQ